MTLTRAALCLGLAAVSGVWLSSVASSMAQRDQEVTVAEGPDEPARLAAEVQEQSRRLRQRLAAGPPAPHPSRNPFEFSSAASQPRSVRPSIRMPELSPIDEPPPVPAALELALIGIATHQRPDGPERTAMMATLDGELIMAGAGDTVLDRFRVAAVGADSVDLVEPATGTTTRLRLDPR